MPEPTYCEGSAGLESGHNEELCPNLAIQEVFFQHPTLYQPLWLYLCGHHAGRYVLIGTVTLRKHNT